MPKLIREEPSIVLRRLSTDDLDAVTELDRLCFPPETAFGRETFLSYLQDPDCECAGAFERGRLAAFYMVYYAGPRAAQLVTIDVHPGKRGKGIGDVLMGHIEDRACQRGVVRIILQVAVDNRAGTALYRKWGFFTRAVLQGYYGPGRDAYLMDKALACQGPENTGKLTPP